MMQSPYLSGAVGTESLIIPVDTGNKQIKTPHHIFTAGLTCHDSYPPFGKDVIQYNGKYYTLSDQRVPYMRDKTADERYFILSLFGIACELRDAGMDAEERTNIVLLLGLPPAHFGTQEERTGAIFTNTAKSISGSTTGRSPFSSARCGSIPRHTPPLPR